LCGVTACRSKSSKVQALSWHQQGGVLLGLCSHCLTDLWWWVGVGSSSLSMYVFMGRGVGCVVLSGCMIDCRGFSSMRSLCWTLGHGQFVGAPGVSKRGRMAVIRWICYHQTLPVEWSPQNPLGKFLNTLTIVDARKGDTHGGSWLTKPRGCLSAGVWFQHVACPGKTSADPRCSLHSFHLPLM